MNSEDRFLMQIILTDRIVIGLKIITNSGKKYKQTRKCLNFQKPKNCTFHSCSHLINTPIEKHLIVYNDKEIFTWTGNHSCIELHLKKSIEH